MTGKTFQVAIDGPVAAGKGTVSRLLADRLKLLYVDTGAMYRVVAYLGLQHKIDLDQEDLLLPLVQQTQITLRNPVGPEIDGRLTTVLVDDQDVSWAIRTEKVSQGASKVAVHPKIREELVKKQQQIADQQDVVMEGRDITFKVLPNADLKIYLTANNTVRAKRRHFDLLTKGVDVEFNEVYQDLIQRDERDINRAIDPLQQVKDAWVIDTSDLSIPQVVSLITAKARMLMKSKKFKNKR